VGLNSSFERTKEKENKYAKEIKSDSPYKVIVTFGF
jgi:hypothetical protein